MKKVLLIGSLIMAFIIVGCSDKANVESDQSSSGSEVTDNTDNTNDTNNNGVVSGGGTDSDMGSSSSSGDLNSIYFKFDKFSIDGENVSVVRSNAKVITTNTYREVRVEGNTDEWGSDEYNYALALKRASAAKDALVDNGVSASSIKLISYGESKPRCLEKTAKCWQENRRVDFSIN